MYQLDKEQELRLIEALIKNGGATSDKGETDLTDFIRDYSNYFVLDDKQLVDCLGFYQSKGFLDDKMKVTPAIENQFNSIQNELDNDRRFVENQRRLARWQVKSFWWIFTLAALGGIYSLWDLGMRYFSDSDIVTKTELKQMLKDFETEERHQTDLKNLLDVIYSDATLINKK